MPANSTNIIKTDTGFKIPRGYLWKIYAKSSLEIRCTEVSGGVIDSDYRGPVFVIFFNFSNKSIEIEKRNGFCQIVFHKIANHPVLREVDEFEDKSDRGEGSFGSTNKNMSAGKIFANNYIPRYVSEDLPWYDRDGLLTYIDQWSIKGSFLTLTLPLRTLK